MFNEVFHVNFMFRAGKRWSYMGLKSPGKASAAPLAGWPPARRAIIVSGVRWLRGVSSRRGAGRC